MNAASTTPLLPGALLGAMALGFASVARAAPIPQDGAFPHSVHEDSAPLCESCHQGVPEDDPLRFYPTVERCNECHEGDDARQDTWTDREPRGGNLRFEHGVHRRLAGAAPLTCAACHVPADGPSVAVSDEVQLTTCWNCHGNAGTDHMVDAQCAGCHMPLAETGFGMARIQELATPADHDPAAWPMTHGAGALEAASRCATCHTSDQCTSCHVDAEREAIAAIPAAPVGMEMPPLEADYPTPDSHADDRWFRMHGGNASRDACATCHTQNDCTACHVDPLPEVLTSLPRRNEVAAPGVGLTRRSPSSHEAPTFLDSHGSLAESEGSTCETCHDGAFCTQCH